MADLSIKLKTEADSASFNSSIKKLETQVSPIKLRVEASTGVSGLFGKSAKESADFFKTLGPLTTKIESTKNRLRDMQIEGSLSSDSFNNLSSQVDNVRESLEKGNISFTKGSSILDKITDSANGTKTGFLNLSQGLMDAVSKFTAWYLIAGVVTGVINSIKQMVTEVVSLDASMVELNKVFDASNEELERVKDRAFELADGLGTTGKAVIDATTEFKRMGYTIDESLDLAKVAVMMTNVAEGITDTGEAANILTSVLKGTGVSTEYAMSLLDRLNEVSNNNAVSFDALANMLQETAATMHILGNNTDETIGMLTGAYSVIQDERVGKALTTIGLRISGLNEDLETEAGLANEVSKALEKYAGINVFDEQTGQIKSTYDIMKELSAVWADLNKNEQAMLLNTLAGKNRADVAAALLTNWEEVDKAIQDASNSMGSAAKEQEAYLNSIEGKIQSFKNVFQELADAIIGSDIVKGFVDIGTGILKVIKWVTQLIEKLGGLKTIILTLSSVMLIFKAQAIAGVITSIFSFIKSIPTLIAKLVAWTTATWAQFTAQMSLQNALTLGVAAVGIIAGITAVTVAIASLANSTNEAANSVSNMSSSYSDLSDTFGDANSELTETNKLLNKLKSQIKELINYNEEYHNSLTEILEEKKAQNEEDKKSKELNEKLLAVEKARQELAEAKKERLRVFRAGVGFAYVENAEEVQSAQESLQEELDELADYNFDIAYDRAQDFVDKLNDLLTSGDIVSGWNDLFMEFSDLLDTQFASYLTEAQKFVDNYNKELEKLNAISTSEKETANESYNKVSYKLSQKKKEKQSYALSDEEQELYNALLYNDEFKKAYEQLPDYNPTKMMIKEQWDTILDKMAKSEIAAKEIEELENELANMPHYAQGTSYHSGGPAIINEKGPELVNLPRGTEVLSHDKTLKLSSLLNNPSQLLNSNGNITLQFNGPLEFPNVRTAEDASGFIDAVISVGNSRVPKYS